MSWKELNNKNRKEICSKCAYCSRELLDKLIKEYDFFSYNEDYLIEPLARRLDNEIFEPIIDHAFLMKNVYGETYLVSNPYYDDETIIKVLSKCIAYNDDNFRILGKERSYYNPNSTNLLLINVT